MLDILTNAPRPVRFGERQYLVGNLKLAELGRLQRWIRDNGVSPAAALREVIDLVPEADRARAVYEAKEETRRHWPPAPGTVEGNTILFREPEGQTFFLEVMLGKFQTVTPAELEQVAAGLSEEDFGVLVAIAFGEDDLDPEQARTTAREHLASLAALQEAGVRLAAEAALDGASSSPTSGPANTTCPPGSPASSPSPSS